MFQNLNLLSTDWNMGISVTITGLVVVFGMLLLLVFVLFAFGLVFDKTPKKAKPVKEEKKPEPKAVPMVSSSKTESNTQSDEIIAVIAAAVASMYEGSDVKPVIRRIVKNERRARPAWTSAGVFENTRSF